MLCRETFHGLGVRGVEGLILVGALLFWQSVAPVSQGGFGFMEIGLFASVS
jgi:hypothetical protein